MVVVMGLGRRGQFVAGDWRRTAGFLQNRQKIGNWRRTGSVHVWRRFDFDNDIGCRSHLISPSLRNDHSLALDRILAQAGPPSELPAQFQEFHNVGVDRTWIGGFSRFLGQQSRKLHRLKPRFRSHLEFLRNSRYRAHPTTKNTPVKSFMKRFRSGRCAIMQAGIDFTPPPTGAGAIRARLQYIVGWKSRCRNEEDER